MSGAQNAVLWLGLLLIAVRALTTGQWGDTWSTLTTGTAGSKPASPAGSNPPQNVKPKTIPTINPTQIQV